MVPETPPFRTASAQLRSTGVTGEWSFTFDAANLTAGVAYRLCVDVDGSSRTRYYGDTLQTVYISPAPWPPVDSVAIQVAGIRQPAVTWSPAAPLSVACFARPQEAVGWWAENETEDRACLAVRGCAGGSARSGELHQVPRHLWCFFRRHRAPEQHKEPGLLGPELLPDAYKRPKFKELSQPGDASSPQDTKELRKPAPLVHEPHFSLFGHVLFGLCGREHRV